MMCLRSLISPNSQIFRAVKKTAYSIAVITISSACLAQNTAGTQEQTSSPTEAQSSHSSTVTIPAGTNIALVLTHPIQSRYVHRGDDIYAQVTFPVESGNEVVIPAGTFVQGKVDKLQTKSGRGELHLQSAAITFPDGYIAPVEGPITLETNQGYALNDPGARRLIGMFVLPAAGAGLGALIGHSVGKSDSTTTTAFPPGCTGPPPFCTTTSTPTFGTKGRDAIIGAGIGGAIGAVASMTLLFSSRHFFIDVGSPVEMTLEHPLQLKEDEVATAMRYSANHPVQPTAIRPLPQPPDTPVDHGTCYTPETPGTPATVIPGTPGPDGIPGPPTIIPGTPPTPGTPYPCP